MKGKDKFSLFAPVYDAFMRRSGLCQAEAVRRGLAGRAPFGSVLDVAGGTGRTAAAVRDLARRVVVADVSPGMLAVARGRGIEAVQAPAEALPFGDGEFDAVLCIDALHHFHEQDAALGEMVRVLRPGGALVVQEFRTDALLGRAIAAFERVFIDARVGFVEPAELRRRLAALGVPGETAALPRSGYLFTGEKSC